MQFVSSVFQVTTAHIARHQPPSPAPVLAIRFGALGDMVLFTADVQRLANRHGTRIDVLSSDDFTAAPLANLPWIRRHYRLGHRRRPWWLAPDRLHLVRQLCRNHYQQVYTWDPTRGIDDVLERHGAVVHRQLAKKNAALNDGVLPRLAVSESERSQARTIIKRHGLADRPLLIVQPGNKRTLAMLHNFRPQKNLKGWPTSAWVDVITRLTTEHPELAVALVGVGREAADCQEIHHQLPSAAKRSTAVFAGSLNARILAGLFIQAHSCISVDTGPAHMAAALGVPLVVLFGPADHHEMRPQGPAPVQVVRSGVACSPCYGTPRRKTCQDNICMQQITPTQVVAAWERATQTVPALALC